MINSQPYPPPLWKPHSWSRVQTFPLTPSRSCGSGLEDGLRGSPRPVPCNSHGPNIKGECRQPTKGQPFLSDWPWWQEEIVLLIPTNIYEIRLHLQDWKMVDISNTCKQTHELSKMKRQRSTLKLKEQDKLLKKKLNKKLRYETYLARNFV